MNPGRWPSIEQCARAIALGVLDGYRQPHDLTSGMTWEDWRISEAYDRAVNVGQALWLAAASARTICTLGRRPVLPSSCMEAT
jgi:hypothetical protein